jgi:hypothetical protein
MLTTCKWEMLVIEYTHSEAGPYNIPRVVSINQKLYLLIESCVTWLVINSPEIEVKKTDFHFIILELEILNLSQFSLIFSIIEHLGCGHICFVLVTKHHC